MKENQWKWFNGLLIFPKTLPVFYAANRNETLQKWVEWMKLNQNSTSLQEWVETTYRRKVKEKIVMNFPAAVDFLYRLTPHGSVWIQEAGVKETTFETVISVKTPNKSFSAYG